MVYDLDCVQPRSQGFSLEGGRGGTFSCPSHLQGKSPGNEVGLCLDFSQRNWIFHEATTKPYTALTWKMFNLT